MERVYQRLAEYLLLLGIKDSLRFFCIFPTNPEFACMRIVFF